MVLEKILFSIIAVSIIFVFVQDNAYATSYTLSDAKSCLVLGGNPSSEPNTCILAAPLILNAYDMLSISPGATLLVENSLTNAGGTIVNYGTLKNFNIMYNIGFVANSGTIINSGVINNYDTLWNSCSGKINGDTIRNNQPDNQC